MKIVSQIIRAALAAVLLSPCALPAADTPIAGLKFTGNVNAGGFTISNLAPSFAQANGLVTGPVVRVETDAIALPIATNAMTNAVQALAAALARATPGEVTNIVMSWIAEWSPTGSVHYADSAGWMSNSNGTRSAVFGTNNTIILSEILTVPGGTNFGVIVVTNDWYPGQTWLVMTYNVPTRYDEFASFYTWTNFNVILNEQLTGGWIGGEVGEDWTGAGDFAGTVVHTEYARYPDSLTTNVAIIDPSRYLLKSELTNAPTWIAWTNSTLSVTVTNDLERPQYLYATGAVSVAFAGLRQPLPMYLIIKGASTVTFPAGTHFIGGASWQTNQANHFLVWMYGTNTFINPITTSEN
ncbi:MAG: hypothetical protein ACOYOU_00820 [Kiritimatiellia bacterium]